MENGFLVTILLDVGDREEGHLVVTVLNVSLVKGGGNVRASEVRPLVEGIKKLPDSPVAYLLVSDRQASRITWIHDFDECCAEVGRPLKWRRIPKNEGEAYGHWKYGRTVWHIDPSMKVQLSMFERSDGWHDYLECGDRGEVEWF